VLKVATDADPLGIDIHRGFGGTGMVIPELHLGVNPKEEDDHVSKLSQSRRLFIVPEFAYERGFYAQPPFSGVLPSQYIRSKMPKTMTNPMIIFITFLLLRIFSCLSAYPQRGQEGA